MNEKSITYDPSAGKWLYAPPGGVTLKFPAGPEGKKQARSAKIQAEAPRIYEMLRSLSNHILDPQIIRRATDGAIYVTEALVLTPASSDPHYVLARVGHSTKTIEYLIRKGPAHSLYRCTCPDWENGLSKYELPKSDPNSPTHGAPQVPGAGIMCKHAWSYHLAIADDRILSIQNPFSSQLANKLHDKLTHGFDDDPLIGDALDNSRPFMFSRGEFALAIPEKHLESLPEESTTLLQNTVLQLTSRSLSLIIY